MNSSLWFLLIRRGACFVIAFNPYWQRYMEQTLRVQIDETSTGWHLGNYNARFFVIFNANIRVILHAFE